jgi:hypothetical protein
MTISPFAFTGSVVLTCSNTDCGSHIRGLVTHTPRKLRGDIHWPPAWSLHEFWGLGAGADEYGAPHVEVLYRCTSCGTTRIYGYTTWAAVGLSRQRVGMAGHSPETTGADQNGRRLTKSVGER